MLLFMDGMSHYDTAKLADKWTAVDTYGKTFTIVAEGRIDGCLKCVDTGGSTTPGYVSVSPFIVQGGSYTPIASGVCGFALKVDDVSRSNGGLSSPDSQNIMGGLVTIQSGTTSVMSFTMNADGTFSAHANGLQANSIEGISSGAWNYLEFSWKIHATSGYMEMKRNGTRIIRFDGNTVRNMYPNSPHLNTWTSVRVLGCTGGSGPSPLTMRMCDFYLLDTAGSLHNDFLGDLTIAYIKPDGVGNYSQWTPSAGNNWACQDEVPPNGDTDYVSTNVVNKRDTYTYENLLDEPIGMQICTYARTETSGRATFKPVTRIAGVDYAFEQFGIGDTAYTYYLQPLDTSPATGVEWTKSEVDAAEFGLLKTG